MRGVAKLVISLLGSVVFAAALTSAQASPGSGGDDLDDAIEDIDGDLDFDLDSDQAHSGSGNSDDDDFDPFDNDDNSGSSNDDAGSSSDNDGEQDRSGSNSGSSGRGGDDDHSGSGRRDDERDREDTSAASSVALYAIVEGFDGEEVVEREYLWQAPSRAVSGAARAGFTVLSRTTLEALDVHLVRLRAPEGMGNARALTTLRRLAPGAIVTPHHVYRASSAATVAAGVISPHATTHGGVIGIIDTGVERSRLPNAAALLTQRSAAGGPARPSEHGSLVASIAIANGARVHAIDVFNESRDGGMVAAAASIAQAIDWMVAEGVPVINISIQGPENPVLNDIIARATARGHIVVAAAGNNGPYARPSFPAAFESALAVTAIDREDRPYVRANRGDYIDFAAEGVEVSVQLGDETVTVSGTSFAAPIVAAQLSRNHRAPSRENAHSVIIALRSGVTDLGAPGHDPVYGWGAVPD
jgi:hypothetical protein